MFVLLISSLAQASSYDLATVADFKGQGSQGSAYYGSAVLAGVDYTGDGIEDLLVGAPQEPWGSSPYPGVVAMYSGGYTLTERSTTADAVLVGDDDHFGLAMAHAGDLDGDGYGDLVVGGYTNSDVAYDNGAVYLLYGPFSGATTATSAADVVYGSANYDGLGGAVWAGDLTGDGVSDVLAAAIESNNWKGAVYQIDGSAPPSSLASVADALTVTGTNNFISEVSGGDLDGDGQLDAVVGGMADAGNSHENAAAWVFSGGFSGATSLADADAVRSATRMSDFAASVNATCDVNQDGHDDLLVGAPYQQSGSVARAGAVFVFYGPLTGEGAFRTANGTVLGGATDDLLGYRMSCGGDTDGDGTTEVLLTAPWTGTELGTVYLFEGAMGGVRSASSADDTFTRSDSVTSYDYTWLGSSTAFVPDVNGDGNDEVFIGGLYASDPTTYGQGYGMAWMAYGPF